MMNTAQPKSIRDLMMHLSSKYSSITTDSISTYQQNTKQPKIAQKMSTNSNLHQNCAFDQLPVNQALTKNKIEVLRSVLNLQKSSDRQPQQYSSNLEQENEELKNELVEVKKLMQEQAQLIQYLASKLQ